MKMTEQSKAEHKILDELRRLRLLREQSDAKFLLACAACEQEHGRFIVDELAYSSFDQWLRSNNLVDPARYRKFVSGLAKVGEREAVRLGAEAVIAAAVNMTAKTSRDQRSDRSGAGRSANQRPEPSAPCPTRKPDPPAEACGVERREQRETTDPSSAVRDWMLGLPKSPEQQIRLAVLLEVQKLWMESRNNREFSERLKSKIEEITGKVAA